MKAETIFAAAYLGCALIAVAAARINPEAKAAVARPFWLRVALICAVFAILRFMSAQMAVNAAVRDFSHSAGLTDGMRPGPYLMIVAVALLGLALAGLFLFRLRAIHHSVKLAALAIVLLILLALAHSLSLYMTGAVLQAQVEGWTVSRILETALLAMLALSGAWFIVDAQRSLETPGQK